jgi:hypothetical protein
MSDQAPEPLELGDVVDELSPILSFAKAVEMIVNSSSFSSGDSVARNAASEIAMTVVDKIIELQERLDAQLAVATAKSKDGLQ